MSIRKGADWGRPGTIPDDVVVIDNDRRASLLLGEHRRGERPLPRLLVTGGDLGRTLGARGDRGPGDDGTMVRVDLGAALVDGRLHWFLAHLVARRSWLRGRVIVAANAAFHGNWNLAPRAHPGDGLLELLDGDPPFGDRLRARRRLPTGTHLPHPDISVRRRSSVQYDLGRPTPVLLDGERVGAARSLSIRVEPDAVEVWV